MVHRDGWPDFKRKGALQTQTGVGGLTLIDDPFKCSCYRGSNLKPTTTLIESGFVRTVCDGVRQRGTKVLFIKAEVNPSQCTADQAHEAWIIARSSGLIVFAHRTCMAGLVKLIFPRVHARCI